MTWVQVFCLASKELPAVAAVHTGFLLLLEVTPAIQWPFESQTASAGFAVSDSESTVPLRLAGSAQAEIEKLPVVLIAGAVVLSAAVLPSKLAAGSWSMVCQV